jgi:mono/diheme cytochrome c family protein
MTPRLVIACLLLAACNRDEFTQPLVLGGRQVAPEVLNRGLMNYRRYCIGCHGVRGDGQGPTAVTMRPAPRDFTRGVFKFTSVPAGALPTDGDILRTLRHGLKGTHMPGWSTLGDEDAAALVQYLKTFSPRWRDGKVGRPVAVPADPWASGGRRMAAIARGEMVYHAVARCWACHPAYAARTRILELSRVDELRPGRPAPTSLPLRDELLRPQAVETIYGQEQPPDFLSDTLRSGQRREDIYRTVAAGIGGTPMPSWHSQLTARDLWAVVRYVEELLRIKGTPEADALRGKVR